MRHYLWDGVAIPYEQTVDVVGKSERLFDEQGYGLWGAREKGSVEMLGFGGFWYFRDPPELELLYGVARPHWGRGLATEIARAMTEYGFGTLRLGVISASTDAPNLASGRVLEKLGFTFDRRAAVGGVDTLFYEMR